MTPTVIPFDLPIQEARLVRRYKRFLADVRLPGGEVLTVHVPNSGSMKTCVGENWPCLISDSGNPARKLRHTLEALHNGDTWIGVQTHRANALAGEALRRGLLPEVPADAVLSSEVPYGDEKSRIDWLAEFNGQRTWVEVKNVTLLMEDGRLAFPDAVTTRGQKHLRELTGVVGNGESALLLLTVQRMDGEVFRPADEIDPDYGKLLRQAVQAGMALRALQIEVSPEGFRFAGLMPVEV